jgi:hypothetical protein
VITKHDPFVQSCPIPLTQLLVIPEHDPFAQSVGGLGALSLLRKSWSPWTWSYCLIIWRPLTIIPLSLTKLLVIPGHDLLAQSFGPPWPLSHLPNSWWPLDMIPLPNCRSPLSIIPMPNLLVFPNELYPPLPIQLVAPEHDPPCPTCRWPLHCPLWPLEDFPSSSEDNGRKDPALKYFPQSSDISHIFSLYSTVGQR